MTAAIITNIVNEFSVSTASAKSFVDFVIRHEKEIKTIYSHADKMVASGAAGMIEEENEWIFTFEEAANKLETIFKCETGITFDNEDEKEMYSCLMYESVTYDNIFNW